MALANTAGETGGDAQGSRTVLCAAEVFADGQCGIDARLDGFDSTRKLIGIKCVSRRCRCAPAIAILAQQLVRQIQGHHGDQAFAAELALGGNLLQARIEKVGRILQRLLLAGRTGNLVLLAVQLDFQGGGAHSSGSLSINASSRARDVSMVWVKVWFTPSRAESCVRKARF